LAGAAVGFVVLISRASCPIFLRKGAMVALAFWLSVASALSEAWVFSCFSVMVFSMGAEAVSNSVSSAEVSGVGGWAVSVGVTERRVEATAVATVEVRNGDGWKLRMALGDG